MKIIELRTKCKIGSLVKYRKVIYPVRDVNRMTNEVMIKKQKWIRCTEVELIA